MEVLSTTNPIPPTGGTNTSVPLGISSSTEMTPAPMNIPYFGDLDFSTPKMIYIDQFQISNNQQLYTEVFTWGVRDTRLKQYLSLYENPTSITPWNLVAAHFSKQVRMEYTLLFYPIKVSDCRVKIDIIVDFNDTLNPAFQTADFSNLNTQFTFDDPDGVIQIPIPQYYVTNTVNTDNNYFNGTYNFPGFLPKTKIRATIANAYHNNALQPETFKVEVFLLATAVNPMNLVGKRVAKLGTTNANLLPYFYGNVIN
jgi:hypothetical protein